MKALIYDPSDITVNFNEEKILEVERYIREETDLLFSVAYALREILFDLYEYKVKVAESEQPEKLDATKLYITSVAKLQDEHSIPQYILTEYLVQRLKQIIAPLFDELDLWNYCVHDFLLHFSIPHETRMATLALYSNPNVVEFEKRKQLLFTSLQNPPMAKNFAEQFTALHWYYSKEIADIIFEKTQTESVTLEELDRFMFKLNQEDLIRFSALQVSNLEDKLTAPIVPIPTGAFFSSSINSQIRKDLWQKDCNGLAFFKHQSKGNSQNYVEHYIANSGDIEILPWEQAEQIIDKFGFDTVKLHLIFAAHTMNYERPWENKFTLKATDIVSYLGWDKRTDLPFHEKLNKIAQTAFVLDCLLVKSVWIEGKNQKGGINASTPVGRMWNIVVDPRGQLNIERKVEKPEEVYITVQPGLIFNSFLNKAGNQMKEALYQFGYLAQNILQIDPYHEELALRLAIHLTMESRYHKSGLYRVETLLKAILPHPVINEAILDKRKAYELKQRWDNALGLLSRLSWQIQFDKSYPEWLQPSSEFPRPPGWRKITIIERILQATIIIKPPEPIPELIKAKIKIQPSRNKQKLKSATSKTKLTGDQIREARKTKGWSQRTLAQYLNVTQTSIGFWESGKRTPSPKMEEKLKKILEIDE